MPITLISGPANAGKAHVVLDELRRHIAHGAEPLLVVPTRADAEHYLRELAGDRAAMGVRVERFEGLIAEAVRCAAPADNPIAPVARERVIDVLAARAGAPRSAGFLRALGDLFAELQVRRVAPDAFARALAQWRAADGRSAAREELGALYADYRATLERLGRPDAEQRAVAALDALRRRPSAWGATPVLFYGFDDLTPLQLDAIETLGRVVDAPVTVSLAYEPGRTAFAGRAASYQALVPLAHEQRSLANRPDYYAPSARAALAHLERTLFEPVAARADPARAVRLLEGGGERAELELIAQEITSLLEGGMEPGEIAVLVRSGGTSLDLLEEVFAGGAIPFATRRRRRLADTAIGRALIGALRCVPTEDGAGELADLLAWLRAPGLLADPSARGVELGLVDSLERRSRRTGVRSAAEARRLWEERNWPLDALDRLAEAQQRGPLALLERAGRELERLFSSPRRRQARLLEASELDEARALASGRAALAELRELARGDRALAPGSAWELARVLERVEIYSGAGAAGFTADAVAVLDPLALRARRVRALFVCGLQEGVFPARARPEPLLSQEERRRLAEVSGLRLGEGEDTLAAERYLLYAAVSRPEQQLALSWHVADDDGEAVARSLFVDDVCDLFDERLVQGRARRALGAVDGARAGAGAPPQQPAQPAGERRGGGLLRDERALAQLRGRVWSASSLEKWIDCPVRWYVERLLAPDALEPPPEPLARGSLAHAVLRDVLDGLREQTGSARVSEQALPLALSLLERALEQNEPSHPLSVAPERLAPARRRLRADLERYLRDCAGGTEALEPTELELGFGFGPGEDADAMPEPAGRAPLGALDLGEGLELRGRIDRVDVSADGSAVVYDYKGGRAPASARWLADGSLQVALYMLAVEQLLGLRVAGGFYQPLSGEDLRARGVLERDSGLELDCVRTDLVDSSELAELLEAVRAAAHRAAAEAARGELDARPPTCAFRGGCMYPAICRCER